MNKLLIRGKLYDPIKVGDPSDWYENDLNGICGDCGSKYGEQHLPQCNDPNTWSDFEAAKRYCIQNRYKGLTFALTEGITFIDIDHAINIVTGEVISAEAKQLMLRLADTYIEKSVSGTGIHILAKGNLPANALNRNDKKGLEMYDKNRFVCMTGELLSVNSNLQDCTDTISELNRKYIGVRSKPLVLSNIVTDWLPSDSVLMEKIRTSKISDRFNDLYNGNYGDNHSSADYALCSLLAWWTRDVSQIDRIFRSSGLYRPKWDSARGNTTYGEMTICRAISNKASYYEPKFQPKNKCEYEM